MKPSGAQTPGGASVADMVISALSSSDASGWTADQIALALQLPLSGTALQDELEELVARAILNRRGVGRGAVYTCTGP